MSRISTVGFAGVVMAVMAGLCGCSKSGSLQVNIAPTGAVREGAQWAVDGQSWQDSGATVTKLPRGNHDVTFKELSGWTPPPAQVTLIVKRETRVLSVKYVQKGVYEGEHRQEGEAEGEGEITVEGEGEVTAEGEGETILEGEVIVEGEILVEGEGEVIVEGEGEILVEGEGEVIVEGEGEGEIIVEGEGEGEGEGEIIVEGEGEGEGEGEILVEGEGKAEVFVDVMNDSGQEDGSSEFPYTQISEGIRAGAVGAYVHVSPGSYYERATLKSGMTLLGSAGAYHTHILPPGPPAGTLVSLAAGSTVRGFELSGAGETGVTIPPGISASVSNCVLEGLTQGVLAGAGASVAVSNTTLYRNSIGVWAEAGATFREWMNNILAGNGTGLACDSLAATGDGFNDYFGNTLDIAGPASLPGDLAVDPSFVALEQGNFHLSAQSACRNAGNTADTYRDLDGSRNDLGADGGPGGVQDTMAPLAALSVTPDSGPSPLLVTMDGTGTDEWGIASYVWDVDLRDGLQADITGQNVQYTYPNSNEYVITLTVTDNSGFSAQAVASVQVNPPRLPLASASRFPIAGPLPLQIDFQGTGSNPDGGEVQFSWDFGDSHTSTEQNPSHVYDSIPPGGYQAVLTVTNNVGACALARVPFTITENAVLAASTIAPDLGGQVVVDLPGNPLNGVSVDVPPGAVSDSFVFAICDAVSAPPKPRGTMGRMLGMVELAPAGLRLSQTAGVLFPVPDPIAPKRPVGAVHYAAASGTWVSEGISGTRYMPEAGPTIAFSTTQCSFFAVGTLWTITSLGTLGGSKSYAFGINDAGMVAGYSYMFVSANSKHAFRWDAVTGMTGIGTLGGLHSYGFAVNASGAVVGCNQVTDVWLGEKHAFVWDTVSGLRDIGNVGRKSTVAQDINASGQIVGYGKDIEGLIKAFICEWDGTGFVMTTLPTLGGPQAYAYGINDSGKVVGTAKTTEGPWHAFVWDAVNGIRDIGVLGTGDYSTARDINDLDEIVGESTTGVDIFAHAFRWSESDGMQDLGTLGGDGSIAYGINHDGFIVGSAQTTAGEWHAFGWEDGLMEDLNDLLPSSAGWLVTEACGTNQSGSVVGRGEQLAYLMNR